MPLPNGTGQAGAAGRQSAPRWVEQGDFVMAHVITDNCTKCGSCVESCPVEAISEGDPKYVIDPDACVDCGQCVDECPAEAIKPEE